MNFKKLLLFLGAPLMLAMAGCQPTPDTPSFADCQVVDAEGNTLTSLSFTAEQASQKFVVKATRSWTIATPSDCTWLAVSPTSYVNTDNSEQSKEVTVTVMANDGAARSASLTLSCGELDPISITIAQADAEGNTTGGDGDGTEASPYSVPAALALINSGQYDETATYYTYGTVVNIKELDTGSYGNATFYISADGTSTTQLYVYRCKYLNGAKFTSADQLKAGDEVVICGLYTVYNTTPQIGTGGYLVKVNDLVAEKPEAKTGPYASDAALTCDIDNSNAAAYTINGSKVGSDDATGVKLGTGDYAGNFTSKAIGVSGSKYLNFYAVAWKGKTATLYYRVKGGEAKSQALNPSDGATGNAPFTALTANAADHYSVQLTGLKESDVIEFSTDASFSKASNSTSGRAIIYGIKLTDSPIEGGQGGGNTEPTPTPGEVSTIASILALGQGATISSAMIEGVVISNMDLNNLTSKKGLYIQDATGGLQFYLGANHSFKFGDKLQINISGTTLGSYNGAVQISGLGLDKITTVSSNNTVEAKTVSMADFLANKYEDQYIALQNVQVADSDLALTWTVTGDNGAHTSINMVDAEGNKFVVFTSKYATTLEKTVAQGSGTIKGIASINVKEGTTTMQLILAQESDIAGLTGERFTPGSGSVTPDPEPEPEPEPDPTPDPEPSANAITIPELYALADGVVSQDYTLNVVVSGASQNSSYGTVYVMTKGATTAGNGFTLYNSSLEGKYKVGDELKVTLTSGKAKKSVYNGVAQISEITDANIEVVSSGNTVNNIVIPASELINYLGMPVTIENATVAANGVWCTSSAHGQHNFTAGGTAFTVYVNKRATNFQDVAYSAATGNISGIAVTYKGNLQIAPRDAEDVKAFASTSGGTTEPDPTPTPDPTPGEGDTTDGTTISQDIVATTGVLDGKTITWDFDEFTVSTNQHNSSTAIRTTDTDHFRAYQGSLLTFTAKGGKKFSKIVVTCSGSSYATELVNSFGASVATANGVDVTITCDSAEVSAEMVKQVRFKKVTVTLN